MEKLPTILRGYFIGGVLTPTQGFRVPPTLKIWLEKNEIFVWKNPFLGDFNLYFPQNFGRTPTPQNAPYSRFRAPPYSENPKITPDLQCGSLLLIS